MSLERLRKAIEAGDLTPPMPLVIALPAARALNCRALLRLLPGKRAVFAAELDGRTVLAKFFTDAAARQLAREAEGYRRLQAAAQPTPELQEQLQLEGGTLRIYRYLPEASPLFNEQSLPEPGALSELLDRLQAMYRAGVYQADLHGGNFLRAGGRLWLIDPGAVEGEPGQPLDSARVVDNLGLLVAQFRRCDQAAVLQSVLAHPVSALAGGGQALHDAAENHWQRRKRDYLAKIFRTSTAVRFERRFDRVWACRRERSDPELDAFLCDPDTAMARGELLKDGNSATVVRTVLDGRAVVIKRYNIKGFGHWLRRFWRPSRAWVSWRNAHLLALVGIDTPAPVAMLERRAGPLRGRAYYVCDSVDAEELLDVAVRRPLSDAQLNALRHLFACLRCAQLHHGDLKAKNILMSTERAWLIDLDALREVPSSGAFDRRHRKDVARFLRNWPDAPALVASMKQVVAGGGIG